MKLRQNRIHYHGGTNKDFRVKYTSSEPHKLFNKTLSSLDNLVQNKPKNFAEIISSRTQKKFFVPQPKEDTKEFYKSIQKKSIPQTQIGYYRSSQLEEKDKQKRVFIGDSDQILEPNPILQEKRQQNKKIPKTQSVNKLRNGQAILEKQDQYKMNEQETQLIGFQNKRNSLYGKVDIEKVRDIRRLIRRKYSNRSGFQKIFAQWDDEGDGYISLKNFQTMFKKLGIQATDQETQVLMASVDVDNSNSVSMDEFMQLIFQDDDKLNVDLNSLKEFHPDDEKQMPKLEEFLRNDAKIAKKKHHRNQLKTILKNNLNNLKQSLYNQDPTNNGYIHVNVFKQQIEKLGLNQDILTEDDYKFFIKQYKCDDKRIDYRHFCQDIFDYDNQKCTKTQYVEEQTTLTKDGINKALATYQLDCNDQGPVHILDRNLLTYNDEELMFKKKLKILRQYKNQLQNESQLRSYFNDYFGLDSENPRTLNKTEITRAFQDLFDKNEKKVQQRDIEGLLSNFTYNTHNHCDIKDVCKIIFNENYVDLNQRLTRKNNLPPPPQNQQRPQTVAIGQNITNYNDKQLLNILTKFENQLFFQTKSAYQVFQEFDLDKDGYVTRNDIFNKLKQLDCLNDTETNQFLQYVDPSDKGFLNFREFSKKIKQNMGKTDDMGEQLVIPSITPNQENQTVVKEKSLAARETFVNFVKNQKKYDGLRPKTRWGATPEYQNTFGSFHHCDPNSAMFITEKQRLDTNTNFKTSHIQAEIYKKKRTESCKIDSIRSQVTRQQEFNQQKSTLEEVRDLNNVKKISLTKWSYEHTSHLKNDWR